MVDNDKKNCTENLNVTIQGQLVPLATSTEIKGKRNKNIHNDNNFENSVIYITNAFPTNELKAGIVSDHENDNDQISFRYLQKSKPPKIVIEENVNDFDDSMAEDCKCVTPTNKENTNNSNDFLSFKCVSKVGDGVRANTNDESYFVRTTEKLCNMTLFDKSNEKYNSTRSSRIGSFPRPHVVKDDRSTDSDQLNDTLESTNDKREENDLTILSRIDRIIDNSSDYGQLNITNIAYALGEKKPTGSNKNVSIDQIIPNPVDFQVLSNKSLIRWIGVPVRNKESVHKRQFIVDWLNFDKQIKSFYLHLEGKISMNTKLSLNQSGQEFSFSDQFGRNYYNSKEVLLEPTRDKKFYLVFNPTDSNYHTAFVLIVVGHRKFKVKLFGYAEAGKIELKEFVSTIVDPDNSTESANKEVLIKYCKDSSREQKMSVFNSGARTAFVGLYSLEADVRFQPRGFLLTAKTKMEVQVTSSSGLPITFFMIHLDEDLRQACRRNFYNLEPKDVYIFLNMLQIFNPLPEEHLVENAKFELFDWRSDVMRQINSSYCVAKIVTGSSNVTRDLKNLDDLSVLTIDKRSKSSMTVCSTSNMNDLLSKTVYMNSAASYVDSLTNALSGVTVLRDVNVFPDTLINETSYVGILIRNNNEFPVTWFFSTMLLTSPHSLHSNVGTPHSVSPVSTTCESSSIYSLASVALYDPTSTMTVDTSTGTLHKHESVLVPVRFRPQNTGLVECKCTVKIYTAFNDSFFEKDVDFRGECVRRHHAGTSRRTGTSGGHSPKIPGVSICDLVDFKVCTRRTTKTMQIVIDNTSNHIKSIFHSHISKPFTLGFKKTSVDKGRSAVNLSFCSDVAGTFEDVLVWSDDDGNSAFVMLRGQAV